MVDVANLSLSVDTSGLAKGEKALTDFQSHARRSETAIDKAMAGVAGSFQNVGTVANNSFGQAATGVTRQTGGLKTAINNAGSTFRTGLTSFKGHARKFGRELTSNMSNVSLQMGDFFTQIASGASATRATVMQLPQLLGTGPLGAALGAAAALTGAVLIPMLQNAQSETKDLKTAMEDLSEAVGTLDTVTKEANKGVEKLSEDYGDYADQIKDVLQLERAIAAQRARDRLDESVASISSSADVRQVDTGQLRNRRAEVIDTIENPVRGRGGTVQVPRGLDEEVQAVRQLSEELGIANEGASNFVAKLAELDRTAGVEDRVRITKELRNTLNEAGANVSDMSDTGLTLLDNIIKMEKAAAKIADSRMGDPFREAAQNAVRINSALSAVGIQGLPSMGATPNALGNVFSSGRIQPFASGGVVDKPTMFPMANGAGLMGEAGPEAVMPLQRGPGGQLGVSVFGKGNGSLQLTPGDGGFSGANDEIQDLISTMERAQSASDRFGQSAERAFVSFVTGASSASESASRLLSRLAEMAAQSAFKGLMGGVLGGGSSSGGGIFSAIFGGLDGARASGGSVRSGGKYLVGEEGPEIFQPRQSGSIIPSGQSGGSGGGSSTIEVSLSPDLEARILQQSGDQAVRITEQGVQSLNDALPDRMAEINQDPARRN